MPLGAATEALVTGIIQLVGEIGGGAVRHYFGCKGCAIAFLGLVGAAIATYYWVT